MSKFYRAHFHPYKVEPPEDPAQRSRFNGLFHGQYNGHFHGRYVPRRAPPAPTSSLGPHNNAMRTPIDARTVPELINTPRADKYTPTF